MNLDKNGSGHSCVTPNLVEMLQDRACREPGRTCYTFLGIDGEPIDSVTYAGLDQKARAIACRLHEKGLAGERALLLYPPGPELIWAFFGCLYAGVVAIPAPAPRPRRGNQRLQAMARDAQAAVAITSTALISKREQLCGGTPELDRLARLPTEALLHP